MKRAGRGEMPFLQQEFQLKKYWLLRWCVVVTYLQTVSSFRMVPPPSTRVESFASHPIWMLRSNIGNADVLLKYHNHRPPVATACQMTSRSASSSPKKDTKAEDPLTPEKVAELIEVSFVNGIIQLSQGYVDVLKLLIAAIQAGYNLGMTPGNLLDTVAECPEQTANRPLMDEEVALRTTWIQIVYLVLDHVKYKGKNLEDLNLANNRETGRSDAIDDAMLLVAFIALLSFRATAFVPKLTL